MAKCTIPKKENQKLVTCVHCNTKFIDKRTMAKCTIPKKGNQKLVTCVHCDTKFIDKRTLDNHVLMKHPNFADGITRKIYECTECSYKTVFKDRFFIHRQTHSECKDNPCIHCSATFSCKLYLDEHLVRKHPNFTKTFHRKIYECSVCIFRTVLKTSFSRHMSKHNASGPIIQCDHCTVTFSSKRSLDDHIVRKHPNFTKTINREIYECRECKFRTVLKNNFSTHLSIHNIAFAPSECKDIVCNHCHATFSHKRSLDDHIVKKHPNFVHSVARKVLQCQKCTYKTVKKSMLLRHRSTHREQSSKYS
ncbi:unnamed protein product [Callosobruchus maculatus]|uniref:C2H2-type domain-containing protein n=1 Tax=Callosobruchus maculatus TaxID=64391 RepID=A0A653DQR1_CALMS|nr:unnamed protein product [Callosobruchus maculatus]